MSQTIRTLTENGHVFAVLPIEEYEALRKQARENQDDVALYDQAKAKKEASFPIALFDALDQGQQPITVFRNHRKLSCTELAKQIGISQAYLSQIEHGTRHGSASVIKKAASALDVPMEMLISSP